MKSGRLIVRIVRGNEGNRADTEPMELDRYMAQLKDVTLVHGVNVIIDVPMVRGNTCISPLKYADDIMHGNTVKESRYQMPGPLKL